MKKETLIHDAKLKPGDIVVLKGFSYDLKMTVESVNAGDTIVKVVYFDVHGKLHKETIDAGILINYYEGDK